MKNYRSGLVAAAMVVTLLATGCGGGTEQGTVVDFGQSVPAGGGMVQSYVVVESGGGQEVTVWLPDDQVIWDAMMGAAGNPRSTSIEYEKDGDFWVYVDVVAP